MNDSYCICRECCIKYDLVHHTGESLYEHFKEEYIERIRITRSCKLCSKSSENYFLTQAIDPAEYFRSSYDYDLYKRNQLIDGQSDVEYYLFKPTEG